MRDLIALAALGVLAWYWLDSLRVREAALAACKTLCTKHGLQLLDETVALRRVRLRRGYAGLRIQRLYRFDYDDGTGDRCTGHLVLLDRDLIEARFATPTATNAPGIAEPDGS